MEIPSLLQILNFHTPQCGIGGNAKNRLDPSRCFDAMTVCDKQTDRQRDGRADTGRERGKKFIDHKQINDVTIKIINLCGRLPARKFLSSWPPMLIQIIAYYSICNTTKSNNKTKSI